MFAQALRSPRCSTNTFLKHRSRTNREISMGMPVMQRLQISTKKQIPNLPKSGQNLSWNTAVKWDLKKKPKQKTTLTHHHPHTRIQATSQVQEYWRTPIRQDSWGRNAQIRLKIKQSGRCVLHAPAASPWEAPALRGWDGLCSPGGFAKSHTSLVLSRQPYFLLFCFPTGFWNSRTSLC